MEVMVDPRLRRRERGDNEKEYTNKEEAKGQRTRSKRRGATRGTRTAKSSSTGMRLVGERRAKVEDNADNSFCGVEVGPDTKTDNKESGTGMYARGLLRNKGTG
jgi:hypothetical protein